MMAITFGGTLYSWSSGNEIALWVVAGVLLLVCIAVAKFHPGVEKDNRLYPAHFLRRPILVNLQVQMFLVSGIVLVCCSQYRINELDCLILTILSRQ